MANQIILSDSSFCRLCAENNTNGTNLFEVDENKQELSELVNTYLPLKVEKDSRYPKTICPGCNIQLEATKSFFDLIINGQFKLKDLLAEQTAILQRQENQKQQLENILKSVNPLSSVESYAIQTDDSGDTFFIKILTDGPLFPQDHELALKIGTSIADKPKKKRGRPAKVHKPEDDNIDAAPKDKEPIDESQKTEEEVTVDAEGRRKRKIKIPSRFNEALKGEELEQAFKKEGVLDEDMQPDYYITNSKTDLYDTEIIGHLQDENGEHIEQLVLNRLNTSKVQSKYDTSDKLSPRFECEYCGRIFNHLGRFEIHKSFHKNFKYQCDSEECKMQFGNKVCLNLHQSKEDHAGVALIETIENLGDIQLQDYKTDECNTNDKESKYICEYCDKSFDHLDKYDIHKFSHKFITYRCEEDNCKIEFDTKKLLDLHQSNECHIGIAIVEKSNLGDQNVLIPEFDNSDAEDDPDYKTHPIVIQKDVSIVQPHEQQQRQSFPCRICSKTFSCKQNYDIHVRAVHLQEKPFHCVPCNKTFPYRNTFRAHMLQHADRKYICDVCQKQFHHPSSLVYHKEAEHNNGRRYICKKCGKAFKHKQLLMRHQLVHSDSRPFTCKLCGSAFKTRPNLAHHLSTHSGERKYACTVPQCSQTFAHKTSLTMHQRWHDGQKPYECDVCRKTFSQKGNLAEHRRIHTGEKPYCCSLCQRRFTTSSQYKLHVKRHTGERPWRCEYCGKTFLHKDTWKCHTRRHRNERPYQCKLCMRGFTEHWALKKHMRLHSGERPHACDQCDKAFADSSNLTKHRRIHAKNAAAAAAVVGRPVVEATATGDVTTRLMDGTRSDTLTSPAVGFNLINAVNGGKDDTLTGDQLLYLTYGDDSNSSLPQTLVHIVDDSLKSDDSGSAIMNSHNVDFDVNDTLRHLVDEEGIPITVTTTEGHYIKVVTTTINDEPMIQGLMPDGTLVAINLTMHEGKSLTADVVAPVPLMPILESIGEKRKKPNKVEILGNLSLIPPQSTNLIPNSIDPTVEEKVALLHQGIDPSAAQPDQQHHLHQFISGKTNSATIGAMNNIEFITEDGQNVCFVYDIDSPLVDGQYLK